MRRVDPKAPVCPAAAAGIAWLTALTSVLCACSIARPTTHAVSYAELAYVLGTRPIAAFTDSSTCLLRSFLPDATCTVVYLVSVTNCNPTASFTRLDSFVLASLPNHLTSPSTS